MIKNKITIFLLLIYFLIFNNHAFARVIRVSECTIPFDFTIGSICVLGTLILWIIVPIILAIVFGGFGIIAQSIKNIFK